MHKNFKRHTHPRGGKSNSVSVFVFLESKNVAFNLSPKSPQSPQFGSRCSEESKDECGTHFGQN